MQPPELCRLLTRRTRRGLIISRILWLALSGCCGFAILVHSVSWAIAAFLAALLFFLGFNHLREQFVAALKVSQDPQIVYWAHSRELPRRVARYGMKDYKVLTLHLRDGHQCEVNLPSDDLLKFTNWLRERNPSVRWGSYDGFDATPKS